MRRLWIVAMAALLLAACHRSGKRAPETADTLRQDTVAAEVVETQPAAETADTARPQKTVTPQNDTMERTELFDFFRKRQVIYNPALLLGEWVNGSEHVVYLSGGKGLIWNTADDVDCEEARNFRWTMDSNLLRATYPLSMGGTVVRFSVVTFLDDKSLVCRDDYGNSYMWDKVNE